MKILLLFLIFTFAGTLEAKKPAVALLVPETKLEADLSNLFYETLTSRSEIKVVDRSALKKVLEEQQLQQSGLVDEEEAVELGKICAANFLLNAKLAKSFGKDRLSAKLIDVEKGNIAFSINSPALNNFKDLKYWIYLVADLIVSRITGNLPNKGHSLENTGHYAELIGSFLKNRMSSSVKIRSYNPFKKEIVLNLKKTDIAFSQGDRLTPVDSEANAVYEVTGKFRNGYKTARIVKKPKKSPKPGNLLKSSAGGMSVKVSDNLNGLIFTAILNRLKSDYGLNFKRFGKQAPGLSSENGLYIEVSNLELNRKETRIKKIELLIKKSKDHTVQETVSF